MAVDHKTIGFRDDGQRMREHVNSIAFSKAGDESARGSVYRDMANLGMRDAERFEHVFDCVGCTDKVGKFRIAAGGSDEVVQFAIEPELYAMAHYSNFRLNGLGAAIR